MTWLALAATCALCTGCTKAREQPAGAEQAGTGSASAVAGSRGTSGPAAGQPSPVTERERIELLLRTLESSQVIFIRNGNEYTGTEAAAHLRRKWEAAGAEITTARDFVEQLGSVSSASGKPYQVKLPDGTVIESRQWLLEQLAQQPGAGSARPVGPGPTSDAVGAPSGGQTPSDAARSAAAARTTPEGVLELIRSSPLTFLRVESDETERYDGPGMAARISAKYALAGRPPVRAEQFVRDFCSRSMLHGTSYLVELDDGKRVPLGDWLLAQLPKP